MVSVASYTTFQLQCPERIHQRALWLLCTLTCWCFSPQASLDKLWNMTVHHSLTATEIICWPSQICFFLTLIYCHPSETEQVHIWSNLLSLSKSPHATILLLWFLIYRLFFLVLLSASPSLEMHHTVPRCAYKYSLGPAGLAIRNPCLWTVFWLEGSLGLITAIWSENHWPLQHKLWGIEGTMHFLSPIEAGKESSTTHMLHLSELHTSLQKRVLLLLLLHLGEAEGLGISLFCCSNHWSFLFPCLHFIALR